MKREIETDLVFLNNQYWVSVCESDKDIIGVTDIDNGFLYVFPRHDYKNGIVKMLSGNYTDDTGVAIDCLADWLKENHPEYI